MNDISQFLRNGLIAVLLCAAFCLLVLVLIAPPRMASISITDTRDRAISGVTVTDALSVSLGKTHLLLVFGAESVRIRTPGYEPAEVELGETVEVFRGNIEHGSFAGFLHNLSVVLVDADPDLRMTSYEAYVTYTADEQSSQVLSLHPEYQLSYTRLDGLRRQYTNDTEKSFDSFPYIAAIAQRDDDGGVTDVLLDFRHADGMAVEYEPPAGWPAGNLYKRIRYSMNLAPEDGYRPRIAVHQQQSTTPYRMGSTLFYCRIKTQYCAGQLTTFHPNPHGVAQAHLEIVVNQRAGDRRVRFR